MDIAAYWIVQRIRHYDGLAPISRQAAWRRLGTYQDAVNLLPVPFGKARGGYAAQMISILVDEKD